MKIFFAGLNVFIIFVASNHFLKQILMSKIVKYFVPPLAGTVTGGLILKYWDNMVAMLCEVQITGNFWMGCFLTIFVMLLARLVIYITVDDEIKQLKKKVKYLRAAVATLFKEQANNISAGDNDSEDIASSVELELHRTGEMTPDEVKEFLSEFFPKTHNKKQPT